MLAPIWYSDRIQAAPMENVSGSNLSISWRTHSCVPRRDSSRRLLLNYHHSRISGETSLDAARRSDVVEKVFAHRSSKKASAFSCPTRDRIDAVDHFISPKVGPKSLL